MKVMIKRVASRLFTGDIVLIHREHHIIKEVKRVWPPMKPRDLHHLRHPRKLKFVSSTDQPSFSSTMTI
jgi:hypothetical protein